MLGHALCGQPSDSLMPVRSCLSGGEMFVGTVPKLPQRLPLVLRKWLLKSTTKFTIFSY